jgi:hypothetical protein
MSPVVADFVADGPNGDRLFGSRFKHFPPDIIHLHESALLARADKVIE